MLDNLSVWHLLSDDDQQALLRPLTDLADELNAAPEPVAGRGRARFDVDAL